MFDVVLTRPHVYKDERGYFRELHRSKRHPLFVQDNHSRSVRGVLRGLHYQLGKPQAKLVSVIRGEIFDVVVDIRKGSDTFGEWRGVKLDEGNQLYIPGGYAHGFCVLSEEADVVYKCSDFYSPEDEEGIIWNDPDLNIDWPVKNPLVSEKDSNYSGFMEMRDRLPNV